MDAWDEALSVPDATPRRGEATAGTSRPSPSSPPALRAVSPQSIDGSSQSEGWVSAREPSPASPGRTDGTEGSAAASVGSTATAEPLLSSDKAPTAAPSTAEAAPAKRLSDQTEAVAPAASARAPGAFPPTMPPAPEELLPQLSALRLGGAAAVPSPPEAEAPAARANPRPAKTKSGPEKTKLGTPKTDPASAARVPVPTPSPVAPRLSFSVGYNSGAQAGRAVGVAHASATGAGLLEAAVNKLRVRGREAAAARLYVARTGVQLPPDAPDLLTSGAVREMDLLLLARSPAEAFAGPSPPPVSSAPPPVLATPQVSGPPLVSAPQPVSGPWPVSGPPPALGSPAVSSLPPAAGPPPVSVQGDGVAWAGAAMRRGEGGWIPEGGEDAVGGAAAALAALSLTEGSSVALSPAVLGLSPPAVLVTVEREDTGGGTERVRVRILECDRAPTAGSRTALIHDEGMCVHVAPRGPHPEQPARTRAVWAALAAEGMAAAARRVPARLATKEEILLVHESRHWDRLEWAVAQEAAALHRWCEAHESLYLCPASMGAARLACGAVLDLTEQVMRGEARNGLAVVRPPGHHAEAHQAMGFCVFNSVAVAAAHARKRLGAQRVLIVDWDIHHGNGIQRIFASDPSVLYFSIHRYERGTFFPGAPPPSGPADAAYASEMGPAGVGTGAGEGTSVNVGWNTRGVGTRPGDAEYRAVFTELLLPIASEFAPDLILIAAGFDAAEGDPLGGCHVTPLGYFWMTQQLMNLAGGRVVVALEGGYSLAATAASAAACMAALMGLQDIPSATHAAKQEATAAHTAASAAAAPNAAIAAPVPTAPGPSAPAASPYPAKEQAQPQPPGITPSGGVCAVGGARRAPTERQQRELRRLQASAEVLHAEGRTAGRGMADQNRIAAAPARQGAPGASPGSSVGPGAGVGAPIHPLARKSIDEARAVQARYWRAVRG